MVPYQRYCMKGDCCDRMERMAWENPREVVIYKSVLNKTRGVCHQKDVKVFLCKTISCGKLSIMMTKYSFNNTLSSIKICHQVYRSRKK